MNMIRVQQASGQWYGCNVDITDEGEHENIDQFTSEGTPIILVKDLDDLKSLNIDPTEVTMVN